MDDNFRDFIKDIYENPANSDDIENKNPKYIYNYEYKEKIVEIKIKRTLELYHLCGYVTLPDDHPDISSTEDMNYDCHGGITFFNENTIGFDTGHMDDFNMFNQRGIVRTYDFVKKEVENLAQQVIDKM